jgi:DNA-binding response OmpR family regulator
MTTAPLHPKILLIENRPAAADQIRAAGSGSFDVEWVRLLSEGLEHLGKKGIAAVLLELDLPDSHGIETFDKLFAAAPNVPILILGGSVPETPAKEAVGRGAQDYLSSPSEFQMPSTRFFLSAGRRYCGPRDRGNVRIAKAA